jgi:hypothetical protein
MANLEPLRQATEFLAKGDWQRAHAIAQEDDSKTGCWVHGVVHLLEGDFDNARYWYRRAGRTFPTNFSIIRELADISAELNKN